MGGFVPASDLQLGDRLSLPEGRSASVLSIRHERAATGSPFTTYNFEVAEHHTYFVGKAGVWVHNSGSSPCQFAAAKFERVLADSGDQNQAADAAFTLLNRFRKHPGMSVANELRTSRKYVDHMDDVFRELKVWRGPLGESFSDVDLARLRLKHMPEDVLKDRHFDWEGYIRRKYDGKDALGEHSTGEAHHLASRNKDYGEHTHHIVMKEGLGAAGKAAAKESQEILASVGIDPFFGKENFVFAGKFPHSDKYAEMVRDRLKAVKDGGGGKTEITNELVKIAKEWKAGRLH